MPLTSEQKQIRDAFGPDAVALIDRQARAIKDLGVDLIHLQLRVKAQGEFMADQAVTLDALRRQVADLVARLPQ